MSIDTNCKCCTKHVPLPMTTTMLVVDGESVWLCPTTLENVWKFYEDWHNRGDRPPGSVRKHYSDYVQKIAEALVKADYDNTSREV